LRRDAKKTRKEKTIDLEETHYNGIAMGGAWGRNVTHKKLGRRGAATSLGNNLTWENRDNGRKDTAQRGGIAWSLRLGIGAGTTQWVGKFAYIR